MPPSDEPDPEQYAYGVPELARTRAYASQLLEQTPEDAAARAVENLRTLGFAVLDNIVEPARCEAVRAEVERVTQQVQQDQRPNRDIQRPGETESARTPAIPEQRFRSAQVDRSGRNNPIALLPSFREYMAHPVLLEIGRTMLDDHLRWCQINYRSYEGQRGDGSPGGFGAVENRGKLKREWHTDWPHDLNAYGGGSPEHNAGAIRQPFPDIPMCLSCVWYLSETGPESGGTWVVPGSHLDTRNPRGPSDGITVSAPIPGEVQCSAPAGSVFIQDTRTWHSSACWSVRPRTAMVSRLAPWWLSIQEFGKIPAGYLTLEQYEDCPEELQPLVRHLCEDVPDQLHSKVLERAHAATVRTSWGFEQAAQDPRGVLGANAGIEVTTSRAKI